MRLLDVFIPEQLLAKFQGPKFGVPGIRQLLNVPERPLSLHIIKPKMGMTPEQVGHQCYQTAMGGVDMMKDDEMTSDVYNSKFEDRLEHVLRALDKAEKVTGKRPIYLLSITDEPRRIFDKARKAVKMGANGLLVCYSAGLPVLRQLAEDPEIDVPIMLHCSHMIAAQPRIAWPVFAKLIRLCGADMMLTPTYWSSIPMVSLEEGIRTSHVKLAPLGHIKPMFPMPCAGVYPGLAPLLIGEYGPDIVIPGRRWHAGPPGWLHGGCESLAAGHRRRHVRGGFHHLREASGEQGIAARAGEMGHHRSTQDAVAAHRTEIPSPADDLRRKRNQRGSVAHEQAPISRLRLRRRKRPRLCRHAGG